MNVSKLHTELVNAGFDISGCNSRGIVWDKSNKEIQDLSDVQAVIQAHDPAPDVNSVLTQEYLKAGIITEDIIYALWKKIMQDDTTDADILQVLIDQVNLSMNP